MVRDVINKKIDKANLPRHIAFIMDGNGRWAIKRGWARTVGHRYGYQKMLMAVKRCADLGIEVCTLYAFSTENWKRPQAEIDEIFRVIRDNMHNDIPELMRWGIRVTAMGDLSAFPQDLQDVLYDTIEKTANNRRCILNLCINYGGRDDIVRAVNKIIEANIANRSGDTAAESVKKITEEQFGKYLYHSELSDPDLVVRTSGEQRVSNFMLWQMAYSEFLFIKPFWPDMTPRLVDECVIEYQKRQRRFGKV